MLRVKNSNPAIARGGQSINCIYCNEPSNTQRRRRRRRNERTNERKKKLFVIKECGPESVSELQKKLKEEEKISTRTVCSGNLRSSASSSPSSCSLFYYYYYYWCHTEEESQRTPILNTNKMCHFLFSSLLLKIVIANICTQRTALLSSS